MDKTVIIIIGIVIVVAAGFWVWQSGVFAGPAISTPLPSGIVLFYGQGCPHCADVEKIIAQNNIDSKVKITRLEVWYNRSNAALLAQVATKDCKITTNTVGVPFLYDGNGHCYIGEVDVPNFLKAQAGIK